MKTYTATIRLAAPTKLTNTTLIFRDGSFIAERSIVARDRGHAVTVVLNWWWKQTRGKFGQAYKAITVDDPYGEVEYNDEFNGTKRQNRYLDRETVNKLLQTAGGKLLRTNQQEGGWHNPPADVVLTKRRRNFSHSIVPSIYKNETGKLFYRITIQPQISKRGVIKQRRKMAFIRLAAKTVPDAIKEIKARGLTSRLHVGRKIKKASFEYVARRFAA